MNEVVKMVFGVGLLFFWYVFFSHGDAYGMGEQKKMKKQEHLTHL